MEATKADTGLQSPAQEVLRRQAALLGWQLASERLSVALKVLTGLAGLAVAFAVAWFVWTAATGRGLVVEAFQTPPLDAARGLNGTVLASKVLDRIAVMDAQSNSFRASDTYENSWGQDLKVEIADAGVSLSELQRTLRRMLGHETRISGELVRDSDLLTLTVRTGGRAGYTVKGPASDLDRLVTLAAEQIYGATQPYQFSKYLEYQGRLDEALSVARTVAAQGPASERAWGWAQIANLLATRGDFQGAQAAVRKGAALDPGNGLVNVNASWIEWALGHDEASLRLIHEGVRLLKAGRGGAAPDVRRMVLAINEASEAQFAGDFTGAERTMREAEDLPDFQNTARIAPLYRATLLAQAHDTAGARALRARAVDPAAEADLNAQVNWGTLFLAPVLERREVEDWPGMAAAAERLAATAQGPLAPTIRLFTEPLHAEALARSGRLAEAQAVASATPANCYGCAVGRAKVASIAGHATEADRLFSAAVRQAPSIPIAYQDWAEAKLARGDLAGALALARQAAKVAPRYADPLKLEGDVLSRQGKTDAALPMYAAAAERAPRWGRLQLAWCRALARSGRRAEALGKCRAAAGLDLSPAERGQAAALIQQLTS